MQSFVVVRKQKDRQHNLLMVPYTVQNRMRHSSAWIRYLAREISACIMLLELERFCLNHQNGSKRAENCTLACRKKNATYKRTFIRKLE